MFRKFLVPREQWREFHRSLKNFCKFWNSKETEWTSLDPLPVVKAQLCILRARRPETISSLPTVLCMRPFCKLWQLLPSSRPAADGQAVRMARAGGWQWCVYLNKAQRLKFHQCPSAVWYIQSFIIISHFSLQLYFRIAVIWISVTIQCSSQTRASSIPLVIQAEASIWGTLEPLSALRDRTVVLQNLFCCQKEQEGRWTSRGTCGMGRRIDKKE